MNAETGLSLVTAIRGTKKVNKLVSGEDSTYVRANRCRHWLRRLVGTRFYVRYIV